MSIFKTTSAPAAEEIPDELIDQAIEWSVKIDFGTPAPETRQAFARWLQQSAAHEEAWRRVHELRANFKRVPLKLAADTLHAVETARKAARVTRRQVVKMLMLAGVTVSAGWLVKEHVPWQRLMADASTAIGQRRTITLADGTVIVLNTDSAVSTSLGDVSRLVVARRGEILITTGADVEHAARDGAKRAFWVQTPFGRLQALGTRFVVRLDGDRARISVQEGAVQMYPADGGDPRIAAAGESWWLSASESSPADATGFSDDAWTDGVLVAEKVRLADFAAELARYRPGRIVVDQRVAGLPVSGIYHVSDTDQVLRFLSQTQPVNITTRTRYWVTIGPREGD